MINREEFETPSEVEFAPFRVLLDALVDRSKRDLRFASAGRESRAHKADAQRFLADLPAGQAGLWSDWAYFFAGRNGWRPHQLIEKPRTPEPIVVPPSELKVPRVIQDAKAEGRLTAPKSRNSSTARLSWRDVSLRVRCRTSPAGQCERTTRSMYVLFNSQRRGSGKLNRGFAS